MGQYIGLDVSLKETAISIRQDSRRIWRGKCISDPGHLAKVIQKHAPHARRVVFETVPRTVCDLCRHRHKAHYADVLIMPM